MAEPESDSVSSNNMARIPDCLFSSVQNKVKDYSNGYIHLDLYVLDKAEFEFSLYPKESKGPLIDAVAHLISDLKTNYNVVGFCILECPTETVLLTMLFGWL